MLKASRRQENSIQKLVKHLVLNSTESNEGRRMMGHLKDLIVDWGRIIPFMITEWKPDISLGGIFLPICVLCSYPHADTELQTPPYMHYM